MTKAASASTVKIAPSAFAKRASSLWARVPDGAAFTASLDRDVGACSLTVRRRRARAATEGGGSPMERPLITGRVVLLIAAIGIGIWLLSRLWPIVLLFFVALIIAAAL